MVEETSTGNSSSMASRRPSTPKTATEHYGPHILIELPIKKGNIPEIKKRKNGMTIREETGPRPTYSNFRSLSRSRISRRAMSISSSSPGPLGTGSSSGWTTSVPIT